MIITSTDNLARELKIRYNLEQRQAGKGAWSKAEIYSLREWLVGQWESLWPEDQLLHPVQETLLALHVIRKQPPPVELLSYMSLARKVAKSIRTIKQYNIDIDAPEFRYQDESSLFVGWYKAAEEYKQQKKWITVDDLMGSLIHAHQSGIWTLPESIELYGYIGATPQLMSFVDYLSGAGVLVRFQEFEEAESHTEIKPVVYDSREQELRFVASDIAQVLGRHSQSAASPISIAVLLPDLSDYRDDINQVFSEVLMPSAFFPRSQKHDALWRFNIGESLLSFDMIDVAVSVAKLEMGSNDIETLSRLLLTDKLGSEQDKLFRAKLDYCLRERGERFFSLGFVLKTLLKLNSKTVFKPRFEALHKLIESRPSKQLSSRWAAYLSECLDALGWPGEQVDSSLNQKLLYAWQEVLLSISSLDVQLGEVGYGQWLFWLRELLFSRMFAERPTALQPIKVMNYQDAAGMHFDHIYMVGASASSFPVPVSLDPFIPYDLQKQAGLVAASPDTMMRNTQALKVAITHCSESIHIGCHRHGDQGDTYIPSPLFSNWQDVGTGSQLITVYDDMRRQNQVDCIEHIIPEVDAVELSTVRGGVSILASHARMPFYSFCMHRLGLKAFPMTQIGLTGRVQGILVHEAMHSIWRVLKDQNALKNMDDEELSALVEEHVELVVSSKNLLPAYRYGHQLVKLEIQRLRSLVLEALNLDKRRVLPFSVKLLEEEVTAVIGSLSLSLRIDRLDCVTLPDGSIRHIVIDYKTNNFAAASDWDASKLTEPQLPVYASVTDLTVHGISKIDGIAFGVICENSCRYILASNFADRLVPDFRGNTGKGVGNWEDILASWSTVLNSHVEEFLSGDARLTSAALESQGPWAHLYGLGKVAISAMGEESIVPHNS